mmetsp:Transcript_8442/g.29831  ORF Transcript_8442/g.29831 Transcript_8442/m.29831 type:complete len:384 (-) Transcript_8442:557-1708(-)
MPFFRTGFSRAAFKTTRLEMRFRHSNRFERRRAHRARERRHDEPGRLKALRPPLPKGREKRRVPFRGCQRACALGLHFWPPKGAPAAAGAKALVRRGGMRLVNDPGKQTSVLGSDDAAKTSQKHPRTGAYGPIAAVPSRPSQLQPAVRAQTASEDSPMVHRRIIDKAAPCSKGATPRGRVITREVGPQYLGARGPSRRALCLSHQGRCGGWPTCTTLPDAAPMALLPGGASLDGCPTLDIATVFSKGHLDGFVPFSALLVRTRPPRCWGSPKAHVAEKASVLDKSRQAPLFQHRAIRLERATIQKAPLFSTALLNSGPVLRTLANFTPRKLHRRRSGADLEPQRRQRCSSGHGMPKRPQGTKSANPNSKTRRKCHNRTKADMS